MKVILTKGIRMGLCSVAVGIFYHHPTALQILRLVAEKIEVDGKEYANLGSEEFAQLVSSKAVDLEQEFKMFLREGIEEEETGETVLTVSRWDLSSKNFYDQKNHFTLGFGTICHWGIVVTCTGDYKGWRGQEFESEEIEGVYDYYRSLVEGNLMEDGLGLKLAVNCCS